MPLPFAAGIFSNFMAAAAPTLLTGAGAGVGIGALGTGLAAGTALAGGAAGLTGLMGGLGSAGALAPGAFGALAPAVATKLAPAAAAQAAGTIGTAAGSVAPGAFGANLAGAAAPGLTGTVGGVAPGAFGANLAGGAGAYNPAMAQNLGAKFLANSPPLAKPFAGETLIAGEGSPIAFQQAPQTANTFSEAGFRGLQKSGLNYPSLSNPTAQAVNPTDIMGRSIRPDQNFMQNLGNIGSFQDVKDYADQHPYATSAAVGLGTMGLTNAMKQKGVKEPESNAMIRPYTYERTQNPEAYAVSPTMDSSERLYFDDQFIAGEPYKAAEGGIAAAYAIGGQVEQMAAQNAVGANTGYPMANLQTPMYSNPAMQRPEATNVIAPSADAGVSSYTGEARFAEGGEAKTEGGYKYSYDPTTMQFTQLSVPTITPSGRGVISGAMGMQGVGNAPSAPPQPVKNSGSKISGGIATPAMGPMQTQQATPLNIPAYQSPEQQLGLAEFYNYMNQQLGGYAGYARGGNVGGESHLGDYSDGGRLLKGPGDGVSDSIPASIGGRQPARLADGEFVVPARIVSELGNGSTEAGARKLYAMMDRIQKGRRKSVGKGKVAVNSKADKHLPA
jgi:hypothetical protein